MPRTVIHPVYCVRLFLNQEIAILEKQYARSLEKDQPFRILKRIRTNINIAIENRRNIDAIDPEILHHNLLSTKGDLIVSS